MILSQTEARKCKFFTWFIQLDESGFTMLLKLKLRNILWVYMYLVSFCSFLLFLFLNGSSMRLISYRHILPAIGQDTHIMRKAFKSFLFFLTYYTSKSMWQLFFYLLSFIYFFLWSMHLHSINEG